MCLELEEHIKPSVEVAGCGLSLILRNSSYSWRVKEEEEEEEEKKNKKCSTTSMTLLEQIFGPDLKLDFMDQSQSLLAKAKMDEYLHKKSKQWKGMTGDQIMDDFLPPP